MGKKRKKREKGKYRIYPLRFSQFKEFDPEYIKKLASIGITNTDQILDAGRTENDREELSKKAVVPLEVILKMVKFADITRIGAISKVNSRVFFEAGADTVENFSKWDPEELLKKASEVIEKRGIMKKPPRLGEVSFYINDAKKLPRIIEY